MRRHSFPWAVSALVGLLASCRPVTPPQASPALAARLDACVEGRRLAPPPNPSRRGVVRTGIQASLISLSRTVPGGFAGLERRLESQGFRIQLTDTTQVEVVRRALLEFFAGSPYVPVTMGAQIAAAPPVQVRWSLAELYDWYAFLDDTLPRSVPRIRGTFSMSGVDDITNRVFYAASDSASQTSLVEALGKLGLPCDLVLTEVAPISTADGLVDSRAVRRPP